jgi:hypothetical protein
MATKTFIALALSGAAAGAVALAAPAHAQTVQAGFETPRLESGRPDLQGSWSNSTLTPVTRARQLADRLILTEAEAAEIEGENLALIEAGNQATPLDATVEDVSARANCSGNRGTNCNYDAGWTAPGDSVMRVGGEPRSSLLTTPDGQYPERRRRVDLTSETLNASGEGSDEAENNRRGGGNRNDNPEGRSLAERCIVSFGRSAGPPMFDQLYNSHYQFVQGKDTLAIWVEMVHDVRVVRIGDEHRTDGIRPWFGDSIGWWEGDTLVVETTNIPEAQSYQGSWQNLTITERYTRVADERLHYAFEVKDPTLWDAPWGGEYEFWRSAPPYEYACHEGNYGLENILAGARAEEAEAAAAAAEESAALNAGAAR